MLHSAWVDLSVEVVSTDSLEVLCKSCRVLRALHLLETPAKSLTFRFDYKGYLQLKRSIFGPGWQGTKTCSEAWGIARDKVEGTH